MWGENGIVWVKRGEKEEKKERERLRERRSEEGRHGKREAERKRWKGRGGNKKREIGEERKMSMYRENVWGLRCGGKSGVK